MRNTTTRLYAHSTGILSNQEMDRLIHCLEIGTGRLAEDVETFKKAAEGGDTPMYTATAMGQMAETFQGYVDEGTVLAIKLRASRDAGLLFSISGYQPEGLDEVMAEVDEAVREEVEARA